MRCTVGLASAAPISSGTIAATVAAFATSSSEISVAISASLEGAPEIATFGIGGQWRGGILIALSVAYVIAVLQA